jgi:hypothetical protein
VRPLLRDETAVSGEPLDAAQCSPDDSSDTRRAARTTGSRRYRLAAKAVARATISCALARDEHRQSPPRGPLAAPPRAKEHSASWLS